MKHFYPLETFNQYVMNGSIRSEIIETFVQEENQKNAE